MPSGLDNIKKLSDVDITNKRVFLRLDLNVPLKDGKITDDTRIKAALPTLRKILEVKCKLVVASHLGRPKSLEDRERLSLEPVAARLAEELGIEIQLIEEPDSEAPIGLMSGLDQSHILMLENLRFVEGETDNSAGFAQIIANYTDVYINDAFGACHRAHSSIHALPKLVPEKAVGPLIEREVAALDRVLYHSESPFVAILGGAKVSDKIGVLKNLMDKVDVFIIGGAMAYTFLKAQGVNVGNSLVEKNQVEFAKDLLAGLEARGKTVLLPKDHIVAKDIKENAECKTTSTAAIEDAGMGVDIGPETRKLYGTAITNAKTVFWNGPMGVFEVSPFHEGTFEVAKSVANCSGFTIVGGGDSASAINQSGHADKVSHISTGGGASLEYLQGDTLPGLEILRG